MTTYLTRTNKCKSIYNLLYLSIQIDTRCFKNAAEEEWGTMRERQVPPPFHETNSNLVITTGARPGH